MVLSLLDFITVQGELETEKCSTQRPKRSMLISIRAKEDFLTEWSCDVLEHARDFLKSATSFLILLESLLGFITVSIS